MFCFFSKGNIYIYIYNYVCIYIYQYTVNLHRPCPDPCISALARAPKHDCPQGALEWSKTKFGSGAVLRACCHRPSHRRCCWLGYCPFGWVAGLLLALGVILELKSLLVAAGALHPGLGGFVCGSLAAAVALLLPPELPGQEPPGRAGRHLLSEDQTYGQDGCTTSPIRDDSVDGIQAKCAAWMASR